MRVMLDTNVLVAVLLSSKRMNKLFMNVCERHTLVLSPYILHELEDVITKKFPQRKEDLEKILSEISYELVENMTSERKIKIRDPKDVPVITGAINGRVEVLITGDRDFEDVDISDLKIMKPSEYQII